MDVLQLFLSVYGRWWGLHVAGADLGHLPLACTRLSACNIPGLIFFTTRASTEIRAAVFPDLPAFPLSVAAGVVQVVDMQAPVACMAVQADGACVVASSSKGEVVAMARAPGLLASAPCHAHAAYPQFVVAGKVQLTHGQSCHVAHVVAGPRGASYAVLCMSDGVWRWDLQRKAMQALPVPVNPVTALAAPPGGCYVAWGDADGGVGLWDVASLHMLAWTPIGLARISQLAAVLPGSGASGQPVSYGTQLVGAIAPGAGSDTLTAGGSVLVHEGSQPGTADAAQPVLLAAVQADGQIALLGWSCARSADATSCRTWASCSCDDSSAPQQAALTVLARWQVDQRLPSSCVQVEACFHAPTSMAATDVSVLVKCTHAGGEQVEYRVRVADALSQAAASEVAVTMLPNALRSSSGPRSSAASVCSAGASAAGSEPRARADEPAPLSAACAAAGRAPAELQPSGHSAHDASSEPARHGAVIPAWHSSAVTAWRRDAGAMAQRAADEAVHLQAEAAAAASRPTFTATYHSSTDGGVEDSDGDCIPRGAAPTPMVIRKRLEQADSGDAPPVSPRTARCAVSTATRFLRGAPRGELHATAVRPQGVTTVYAVESTAAARALVGTAAPPAAPTPAETEALTQRSASERAARNAARDAAATARREAACRRPAWSPAGVAPPRTQPCAAELGRTVSTPAAPSVLDVSSSVGHAGAWPRSQAGLAAAAMQGHAQAQSVFGCALVGGQVVVPPVAQVVGPLVHPGIGGRALDDELGFDFDDCAEPRLPPQPHELAVPQAGWAQAVLSQQHAPSVRSTA